MTHHSDTCPQEHRYIYIETHNQADKKSSVLLHTSEVLQMYEMEGSTFISNWIQINVIFNSRYLILQAINTLIDFRKKKINQKIY